MDVHGYVMPVYADGLSPATLTMSVIVDVAFLFYVAHVSCKYVQKKKKEAKKEVTFVFS